MNASRLFTRVLFATDFSTGAAPAFDTALRIAKDCGASLLLCHAYELTSLVETGYISAAAYDEYEDSIRERAEDRLQKLADEAKRAGVDAEKVVVCGFPDQAIVDVAAQRGADLIVIGTHGRRGMARLFLGSVAARVIATSSCPVLTIRCAGSEK
jgi:nucleotide-binding universal stress UspA family protein